MTSLFVRAYTPDTNRAARTVLCVFGVTAITACTRVDAASVPALTMRSADITSSASFTAPVNPVSFNAPPGTYDAVMAQRGKVYFNEYCAQCHVKAKRSAKGARPYVRLRHLGRDSVFFKDGSASSLDEVITHYEGKLQMHLTKTQRNDLVEYLKSH